MAVPHGMRRFARAHPPWGWKFSLATAGIFTATYIGAQVLSLLVLVMLDIDLDSPGGLEKDEEALTVLLAFGLLQQAGSVAFAVLATRVSLERLIDGLGLARWQWTSLWRPALMTIALYIGVALWAFLMDSLGIGWLEPESTVDEDFVEGPLLIVISFLLIVIGAPLAEEFVFRGAIFGGLLPFGFWPAALVSGVLFALVHFNLALIPAFTGVGVGMAYLYWSRGSLWDSIFCHAFFNFTSYLLLVAGATD